MMWVALLKLFAFLGRMAAFAFAVVSLALISLTLVQRDWMDGISIYIVVIGVISIFASLVPPYPNFIFDSFFALAWAIGAIFSFLIMFLKSTCYGVADVEPGQEAAVACPKYQALVAMCFLEFAAWVGCAAISGLLIVIAIFKNARLRSHHAMIKPTVHREEQRTETTPAVVAALAPSAPVPPIPASAHAYESRGTADYDGPFVDPPESLGFAEKRSFEDEKRPYSPEKRPYSEEKKAFPLPYSETYHVEDAGESHKVTAAAVPVSVVTETRHVEEQYEQYQQSEPEYMTVSGWGTGWIIRHWLLLLFLAMIAAAILLPLLIIYAVPAFAYYVVDNIQIPDNFFGEITAFNEDHATFDIHTSFKAPAGISATIKPMTLAMFVGDTIDDPIPLAYVQTTNVKVKGGHAVEAYNQTLRIGNITEWSRLWRKFAFQDTLEIGIAGEIKIKAGPITLGVETKKVKAFQGLLNASALALDYVRIQPPDEDGANIVVAVPITNPSPLTVNSNAGATADLMLGDSALANIILDKFTLVKGTGTLVARAKVDLEGIMSLINNIGDVLGSQLPFIGRGMAVATLQATAIIDHGVAWPYWIAGARAIKLAAAVEILPLVGGLAGDILGPLLAGDGGSLFGLEPMTQVVDLNVTAINKVLRETEFYDAVDLGYA